MTQKTTNVASSHNSNYIHIYVYLTYHLHVYTVAYIQCEYGWYGIEEGTYAQLT